VVDDDNHLNLILHGRK